MSYLIYIMDDLILLGNYLQSKNLSSSKRSLIWKLKKAMHLPYFITTEAKASANVLLYTDSSAIDPSEFIIHALQFLFPMSTAIHPLHGGFEYKAMRLFFPNGSLSL